MPFQESMIIFKYPYRRHPVTAFLCVGHPKINTWLCFRANIKTTTCLVYSTTSLTTKSYTPKTNMTCRPFQKERIVFQPLFSGHILVFGGVRYSVAFTGVIISPTQTSLSFFHANPLKNCQQHLFNHVYIYIFTDPWLLESFNFSVVAIYIYICIYLFTLPRPKTTLKVAP